MARIPTFVTLIALTFAISFVAPRSARAQSGGDRDGDGLTDDVDNCPGAANPAYDDTDGDGMGDE